MQETLSSFDVAAIVLELKEKLEGARVQNIYQIKNKIFILKLHKPNQSALHLLLESGKRLNLTSYHMEKPRKPPAFCMALRKHLRNGTIVEISQHEFERVVTFKIGTKKGEFSLVLELFGDGNIILVDSQAIIQQALTFKKMRDRNILRRERFQQVPSSGKNPLQLDLQDLFELKKFGNLEVVKALTKLLSLGGMYAEEILFGAQVNKKKMAESLEKEDFDRIYKSLIKILDNLKIGKLEPCIVLDERGKWIDVVPIRLRKNEGAKCKRFNSFNDALDEYYAKILVKREVTVVTEKGKREIARLERILHSQRESLEKERQKAEQTKRIGDVIYVNLHQLHTLSQRILEEKKTGKSWGYIVSKIEEEKRRGIQPSVYFESLDTKRLLLSLTVEGLAFSLKLRYSLQENAASFYEQGKKAKRKVKGAEIAMTRTLSHLQSLRLRRQEKVEVQKAERTIEKRRKRKWYEKFRWFYTSENLLVIGGKDAVTNEILMKKHMEPQDLVFHADIIGAPFVLLKTKGKTPSTQSKHQAAQLAASHSRAWKNKLGAIDVYWVHPEQVSKTPPSGEYLRKGAFMIRGKKNHVRKVLLRLAVGVNVEETPIAVIGGPKEALKVRTDLYVEITPGSFSSGKLARKIRQTLGDKAPEKLRERIFRIPLDEIQTFIPYGMGVFASSIL